MKSILTVFVFCFCVVLTNCSQKPVSSAITQIVQQFFENRSQEFDIITCGPEWESLNEIVDEIGKGTSLPYRVLAWSSPKVVFELRYGFFFESLNCVFVRHLVFIPKVLHGNHFTKPVLQGLLHSRLCWWVLVKWRTWRELSYVNAIFQLPKLLASFSRWLTDACNFYHISKAKLSRLETNWN